MQCATVCAKSEFMLVMVKALAGSQDIVNFVSCLYITRAYVGFLKLADIVLILINPSPCYVKYKISCWQKKMPLEFWSEMQLASPHLVSLNWSEH